ncbi:MAG TPA: hypothetical protein VGR87_06130 [Candidatus Limnocylindria bacterium]|nr:hypothetical protein [Candidatus Limnocylindria bacterium]
MGRRASYDGPANLDLPTVAQLISTFTVVAGFIFAVYQVLNIRRQRRDETALTLIRTTVLPDAFGTTVISLPEDATVEAIRALGPEAERAIISACVTYENLGYLVYLRMVPLRLVEDLHGGLVRQAWRKLRPWVAHARAQGNPNAFEWFEWLNDRLEAHHAPAKRPPAPVVYRDWRA